MTVSEMVALLRIYIEAPETTVWTDAQLTLLLNQAYKQTVAELDKTQHYEYVQEATISVPTNSWTVSLATWAPRVIVKLFNLADRTEKMVTDRRKFPFVQSNDYAYWDKVGQTLRFFDQSSGSSTYVLSYVPAIETLTTAAPLQLPADYHDLIVLQATVLASMSEQNTSVNTWIQQYNTRLQALWHNCKPFSEPQYVREYDE